MTYNVSMTALKTYADSLPRNDSYRCPKDILKEEPQSAFSDELQTMYKQGKKIVDLAFTESLTVSVMQSSMQSLHRIARRVDTRTFMLKCAIVRVPVMEGHCSLLSKPIDTTKGTPEVIAQILDRALPKISCTSFFGETIGELPLSSAVKAMREELERIDLDRCKEIASEYESSAKEIRVLAAQLKQAIDKAETQAFG